jgi:DNA replication and repair protein RecF
LLHRLRAEGRAGGELDGFTKELAHHGARITVGRTRLVRELAPLANEALRELSGGGENLELAYLAAHERGCDDAEQTELDLLDAYRSRAAEELARAVSVVGPHRDDLSILVGGRPARTTASQGQQRSIVLAIKLAEMRHLARCTGASPVVMLDDVLSELDQTRRGLLLSRLGGPDAAQVLITTTEPLHNTPGMRDAQHFTVTGGSVVPDA